MALGLAALAAVASFSAHAARTPTSCGKIEVGGHKFQVKAHKVSCDFARRWSKHFLKRRHRPDGWTCTRYSADESDIAFSCRNGTKTYYAVRK